MDARHISSISERAPDKAGQVRDGKTGLAGPRRVIWELAHRCNTYCGHRQKSAESRQPVEADRARTEDSLPNADLTTAESLALVTELAQSGVSTVVFLGGPDLRPDSQILIRHARDRGLVVENMEMGSCDPEACRCHSLTPRICPDGTVTPCVYSMTRIGSLRRHSLLHIWRSSPLVAQLHTHIHASPASCTACEHRDRSARMGSVAGRALLMDTPRGGRPSVHAAAS